MTGTQRRIARLAFSIIARLCSKRLALALLALCFSLPVPAAAQVVVAVASNFVRPAEALAQRFAAESGNEVVISPGSTGKLYAQVVNGAPYAALLAADADRPERLEASGLGVPGTRFTYARGNLVLWSVDPTLAGADCRAALKSVGRHKLAIANPLTAPYGAAAKSFLEAEQLWSSLESNLVYGENISQALHFVATGNARLGLVAAAQLTDTRLPGTACSWTVPNELHEPIEQQAILLQDARDDVARDFLAFVASVEGREIIRSFGYTVND